jgi:FKBP12-rapamycin complex-associated protein
MPGGGGSGSEGSPARAYDEGFEPLAGSHALLLERVTAAATGFFRSIALARLHALQDLLRLLTLWFRYGGSSRVEAVLREGFESVDVDMWLLVVPQLIARIAAPNARISKLVHALLLRVGAAHPQALIYPLAVAAHERGSPTPLTQRRVQAERVLSRMRAGYDSLVEQALLVADELVRVAILWPEQWQDALDEGYR